MTPTPVIGLAKLVVLACLKWGVEREQSDHPDQFEPRLPGTDEGRDERSTFLVSMEMLRKFCRPDRVSPRPAIDVARDSLTAH